MFFNKVKKFFKIINNVESSIFAEKEKFTEVYERNIELEKEIVQRTNELNQANQTIITLQSVWDMMNSSQPLSSVLEKIITSLQGDLGYITCLILKKESNEDEEYFTISSYSENLQIKEMNTVLDKNLPDLKLKYSSENMLGQALEDKEFKYTNDLNSLLEDVIPDYADDLTAVFSRVGKSKTTIFLPLFVNEQPFGGLVVFSPRAILMNNEKNFLTLFANQIELAITIANLFEGVKKQADTDPLTDLYNRRYFEEAMKKEISRAGRLNQPFSIISLDLDHLKRINDTYGHAIGDTAIITISNVLKKNARSIDIPCRFGGEEFCILLPGIDSYGAVIAAERLRAAIEKEKIDIVGKITASIGVSTFLEHADTMEEMIELADQAMYKAKVNGRNQVQIAHTTTDSNWQDTAMKAFIDILSKKRIPIPDKIAEDLTEELKQSNTVNAIKDILYNISDTISQSYNDNHTTGLAKQKVHLAVSIAKQVFLQKEDIEKLKIAVLMYDIGNLNLPKELLDKKEPLTQEEIDTIKSHPIIAARNILEPISEVSEILPIIEHHHENWDGTGYPSKIAKRNIPLSSQIILLVDTYFALMQDRPYRKALSRNEAILEIKKLADKKWSKKLIDAFDKVVKS